MPRLGPRARKWVRRAARLCVTVVVLLLLAVATFEAAVRLLPYPPGVDRPPPASSLLLDRSGTPLASFAAADGRWHLPLADAEVSPHLLAAVVAVEDARFASHAGVDWPAVVAAMGENAVAGRIRRGGSTLTMQLHRLRDPRPRGWVAKLGQAVHARQIERTTTKRQILVEYVNRAPFGGGLVGAGAASWRYFGKPCASLSLGEAAMLAGLPQNPNRLRPDRHPQAALARRHHVLERMAATGAITPRQQAEADAEPLTARWRPLPQDRQALIEGGSAAGGAETGATGGERPIADGLLAALLAMKPSAGGRVATTIDADVQRTACSLAADRLSALATSGVTAVAVVVLDTASAECLASASLEIEKAQGASRPAGDIATAAPTAAPAPAPMVRTSALDLTRRPRSTGSVLKPFIYAAAFDAGIATPTTVLRDEPAAWPGYAPANYDRSFGGPMTAADALARSRNIPALLLLEQVGVERAVGVLDAVGIGTPGRAAKPPGLALAIGGADASPMEIAEGFAALARGGVPRPATSRKAEPDPANTPTSTPVTTGAVAVAPAPALRPAACWATMRALAARDRTANICPEAADTRVAWKTGTSSGHRDAWCAAATPAVTVVVWLGNAGGQGSTALVGQDAAAPLALRLIAALDRGGLADRARAGWPGTDDELTATARPAGRSVVAANPRLTILSPAAGAAVVLDPDLPADRQRVPLRAAWRSAATAGGAGAAAADDGAELWWFVDGTLVARRRVADRAWWVPTPGEHDVRAADAAGRGVSVRVTVLGAR